MTLVWITVARGLIAIALGLALALNGDRAPAALVKFMGVYWILNGIITLRLGLAAEGARRRLAIAAGAIGIATGATVLLADVGTTFLLAILGVVIALTGLAHLLGGFEIADVSGRRWRPGVPLGIVELGLGATLLLTSEHSGSLSTWLASAWALLGGGVLVADALAIRRRLSTARSGSLGEQSPIYNRLMAMEIVAQRLEIGDVVLLSLGEGGAEVEATVVRDIDRTDATVRATMRVEGREDFVKEWPLGELVTVVRGP